MVNSSDIELIHAKKNDWQYVYELLCFLEQTSFDEIKFKKNYMHNLGSKNVFYYIILYNNVKCGFISMHCQVLLHHNSKVGEIQEFIIHNQYRNRGIGKIVLSELHKICLREYIEQLEVCTNKKRIEAQEFYKKTRFTESHYKYTMEIDD